VERGVSESEGKIKRGVERRLEFIEFRLFWEGGVRRSDIMRTFDVSEPQASKDLTLYQQRAPRNAVYDKILKRYVAGPDFEPVFLTEGPSGYLNRLRSLGEGLMDRRETWLGSSPDVDIVLNPAREVDAGCLHALLKAVRERQSLEVRYQSMSKSDPSWRRITPHAFGFDGFRWHARAFCHSTELFKDFLIPRIGGARDFGAPGLGGDQDDMWKERFGVVIGPHPKLSPNQRAGVEKDYGMKNGIKLLEVRYAMLFYVLRRLGLRDNPETKNPRTQHIVVVNKDETEQALLKADWAPLSA
jgi:hypothetical protein